MKNVSLFLFEMSDIFKACREGNLERVRLMLETGQEKFDVKDNSGRSLAYYACKYGQVEILKYLVDKDPKGWEILRKDGRSPVDTAITKDQGSVIAYILQNCPNFKNYVATPIYRFYYEGNYPGKIEVLRAFYNWHPEKSEIFSDELTLSLHLRHGLWRRNRKYISFIASSFSNFQSNIKDYLQRSNLFTIHAGNLDFLEFLISVCDEGFNVLNYDEVFHRAVYRGNLAVFEFLKAHLPNYRELLSANNALWRVPLDEAIRGNKIEMALWIIENHVSHHGLLDGKIEPRFREFMKNNCGELKRRLMLGYLEAELESTLVFSEIDEGLCREVVNVVMQNTELAIIRM